MYRSRSESCHRRLDEVRPRSRLPPPNRQRGSSRGLTVSSFPVFQRLGRLLCMKVIPLGRGSGRLRRPFLLPSALSSTAKSSPFPSITLSCMIGVGSTGLRSAITKLAFLLAQVQVRVPRLHRDVCRHTTRKNTRPGRRKETYTSLLRHTFSLVPAVDAWSFRTF